MTSVDAMATRLTSSLTLAEGKKQVDLRPTKGEGLRQADVFMVGKLLTAREFKVRSFLGMFRNAWRVNGSQQVEEAEGQRVLFTFSDPADREQVWRGAPWGFNRAPVALAMYDGVSPVEQVPMVKGSYLITLLGIPSAFRSERIIMMIGYTLGDFQEIDKLGKRAGKYRIRVEIPFTRPLLLQHWYLVEDEVEFLCKLHYDKLFGRCGVCGLITHVGLPCSGPTLDEEVEAEHTVLGDQQAAPTMAVIQGGNTASSSGTGPSNSCRFNTAMQTRFSVQGQSLIFRTQVPNSIPKHFLPTPAFKPRRKITIRELNTSDMMLELVTGKRRDRGELEITISPKKVKLSLAVGKKNLQFSDLILVPVEQDVGGVAKKKKRGRPVGSKNNLLYGTVSKTKATRLDGKERKEKVVKTNLLDKLNKLDEGPSSNLKGKELVIA